MNWFSQKNSIDKVHLPFLKLLNLKFKHKSQLMRYKHQYHMYMEPLTSVELTANLLIKNNRVLCHLTFNNSKFWQECIDRCQPCSQWEWIWCWTLCKYKTKCRSRRTQYRCKCKCNSKCLCNSNNSWWCKTCRACKAWTKLFCSSSKCFRNRIWKVLVTNTHKRLEGSAKHENIKVTLKVIIVALSMKVVILHLKQTQ